MDFKGKNVAYVGGFGGIGMAVSKQFLQQGITNLVVLDYQENPIALSELQSQNSNTVVHFEKLDITSGLDNARHVLAKVFQKFYIDILVNGAGIADEHRIEDLVQINFAGLININTAAIELWDKRNQGKGGLVVNIASILALRCIKEMPTYCATKAGVVQFTRAIALQKPITGVNAIAVCPGVVTTPLLNRVSAYMNVTDSEVFRTKLKAMSPQTPEAFAASCVEMLKIAENGSVWHIIEGQATLVKMPVILDEFVGLE